MVNSVKRIIRKNKLLSLILKPVYHFVEDIVTYKERKMLSQDIISNLSTLKKGGNYVWYFGVPTHMNLGDLAQKCCIVKWVENNYPSSKIVEISSYGFNFADDLIVKELKSLISHDDLIVMQSGYTMTGIHPDENAHRLISKNFKENKILFFPQTILFEKEKEKKKTVDALESNNNVILLTRDLVSNEKAKEIFNKTKIYCYPDIVTSQIGKYTFDFERKDILFCMRNDAEQLYLPQDVQKLMKKLEKYGNVTLTDTTVNWKNTSLECASLWKEIYKVIQSYAKYKLIVTDRYHGTIFSLIAGTPVVVLKTNDHKVETGANWFKGVYDDYVILANNLEDVEKKAEFLLSKEVTHKLDNYFEKNYYENLKNDILENK